jgi:ATP-dependent Lhr-like helicase
VNEKFKGIQDAHILIITPESLESLLTSSRLSAKEIFQQLEYIVVDEIHYFAASPRGYQLISLINRVSRYSCFDTVKVGLSATVENKEAILSFLTNSDLETERNKVVFTRQKEIHRDIKVVEREEELSLKSVIVQKLQNNPNRKFLVFSNSRSGAEKFADDLSHDNIKVEVHHASVGKEIRKTVEKSFKQNKLQVVIATSTLELGIDIGNIDQVFFLDVPNSASSFLQRLGRSGRKSGNPKCWVQFNATRTIDVLRLLGIHYMLEMDSVESIKLFSFCPQIFAHQLISFVYENDTLSVDDFKAFSDVYCYRGMRKNDRTKTVLEYLVKQDYFYKQNKCYFPSTESLNALEKAMNKMNFVGVFSASSEYSVECKGVEIGSISYFMYEQISNNFKQKQAAEFRLANKAWRVSGVNEIQKKIYVERSNRKKIPVWYSKGPLISFDFAQAMKAKLAQSFEGVEAYLSLMTISRVAKPLIASIVETEKLLINYSELLSISSIEIGGFFVETVYTYFGDVGNYFLKSLLTVCDFKAEQHDFRMIKVRSNTGMVNSIEFQRLIFSQRDDIKSRLFVYLLDHFKGVKSIYELFGDKLGRFIPDSSKTDFVVEYLYDERIIEILRSFFKEEK